MLKVELSGIDSTPLVFEDVIAFGSCNKESRVICVDHAPAKFLISNGKVHILHKEEDKKKITSFYVTSGVVCVNNNVIIVTCLRFYKKIKTIEHKIQDSLNNEQWKKFVENRLEEMNKENWIDKSPDTFSSL